MLLGFPVMPAAPYLKVEVSGLIIFLTLLWFDWKTAALVSLYTNFIHVFMPGSAPVIIFLDEGVNFIATMVFILPTVLFLKKTNLTTSKKFSPILLISIIGAIFTAVIMTLYNAFINLPIIYGWPMPFWTVVEIFGVFNLIKWGLVAIVINLTWKRLYKLRNFGEEEETDEVLLKSN
jgi:riboflavin transporter FmnP